MKGRRYLADTIVVVRPEEVFNQRVSLPLRMKSPPDVLPSPILAA